MITLTVLIRLGSLLLTIYNRTPILEFSLRFYLTYQLPFDTLNIAIIAQFFQWLESLFELANLNPYEAAESDNTM